MSAPLNQLDASILAKKLATREITSEQLVRDCLDRINEREADVQAWVHLAAEPAIKKRKNSIADQ